MTMFVQRSFPTTCAPCSVESRRALRASAFGRISYSLLLAVFLASALLSRAATIPNVAAASDLQFALPEVAARFAQATGREVKLAFGSSGNFRRQIAEGAPFELFFSADEAYVDALAKEERTEGEGVRYATGRIVLFAPHGSTLRPDPEFKDLAVAVADSRIKRFAIANPEHAPYGRAAREALQRAGVWEAIVPRLVLGENVSQAAQFASSGGAQGGIFAYSLALSPAVAKLGTFVLIPAHSHRPLNQRMVLVKGAGETAREFYRYMQQPATREIFRRFGFALPDE